jgi:imidazolonepropionase-like amidohydrolase
MKNRTRSFPFYLLLSCLFFVNIGSANDNNENFTTTDDNRRVPIPPTDYSKEALVILSGGTLIDGTSNKPVDDALVAMRGDRIIYAGSKANFEQPLEAGQLIDTSGLFIIPGLIDLHLHFTQQHGEDFGRYRDSDAAATVRGVKLLEQLADAGITSVRDGITCDY